MKTGESGIAFPESVVPCDEPQDIKEYELFDTFNKRFRTKIITELIVEDQGKINTKFIGPILTEEN